MILKIFVASCLFSLVIEAAKFDVDGRLTCDCQECRSVANVQLWEKDKIGSDDYFGDDIVQKSEFHLKFDELEVGGVSPYLVIRHDCIPSFWSNGKKDNSKFYCYVQEKYEFDTPSGSVAKLDVFVGKGDYKDMEICLPRDEFKRIFGGEPISRDEFDKLNEYKVLI